MLILLSQPIMIPPALLLLQLLLLPNVIIKSGTVLAARLSGPLTAERDHATPDPGLLHQKYCYCYLLSSKKGAGPLWAWFLPKLLPDQKEEACLSGIGSQGNKVAQPSFLLPPTPQRSVTHCLGQGQGTSWGLPSYFFLPCNVLMNWNLYIKT